MMDDISNMAGLLETIINDNPTSVVVSLWGELEVARADANDWREMYHDMIKQRNEAQEKIKANAEAFAAEKQEIIDRDNRAICILQDALDDAARHGLQVTAERMGQIKNATRDTHTKIQLIRELREASGCGLKDAKEFVEWIWSNATTEINTQVMTMVASVPPSGRTVERKANLIRTLVENRNFGTYAASEQFVNWIWNVVSLF